MLIHFGIGAENETSTVLEDIPRPTPPPCYFSNSFNVTKEQAIKINQRCREKHYLDVSYILYIIIT